MKGRALARPSERSERFEPVVRSSYGALRNQKALPCYRNNQVLCFFLNQADPLLHRLLCEQALYECLLLECIQKNILDPLAKKIVAGEVKEGGSAKITVANGEIVID